jgi:hypothetical protein
LSRITTAVDPAGIRWPLIYFGVAFTTLATLLLELALTRIFSVVFYYHMAFLAISVAMFGLGAGGVISYLFVGRGASLFRFAGKLALANSFTTLGVLVWILAREKEPAGAGLLLLYGVSSLPFLMAGAVVSLVIAETIARVDRVYFSDLAGAAGGCLLLIPLLNTAGGPGAIIAAAVIYAVSAAFWYSLCGSVRGRIAAVGVALGLMMLLVYNARSHLIDIRFAKNQRLSGEYFVKWNSFSRIAVTDDPGDRTRRQIVIDADASTGIANFNPDRLTDDERRDLLYQGPGLPYVLRPAAKTLIIGPGGGWDVMRALASGSRDVTGVEINPIIAETIMRRRFPHLSQRLYFRPEVRMVIDDGRSFIRRSRESYGVIQATLVDTWAATAAGAFALSENSLYTVEAFGEYLERLAPDGVLAFTRWGFEPPRESLRLVTLAMEAMLRAGVREPWRQVIVARENPELIGQWGARDTVLFSRSPFTAEDSMNARLALQKGGMQGVYLPGDLSGSAFADLLRSRDPNAFLDSYPFDVSPVDDNRPFFFYTVQPRDVLAFVKSFSRVAADYKINRAVPMLFGVLGVSVSAVGVVLLLPPIALGSRLPRRPRIRRFLAYFVFIGSGYILIQVSLIQKFVLFLGHPVYALTVIIFSMLVSSGLGSYFSRRLVEFEDGRLIRVLAVVFGLAAGLAFALGPLTQAGVAWALWQRVAVTIALIAPLGFLMGMPFPSGLARLESWHQPAVKWAWSLNAAASVLGSAAAIFLAIYLGLRETMLIGASMYVLALASVRWTRGVVS